MTYEHIFFTVQDRVATITFNRPKALNALNRALLAEFASAIDQVEDREDIHVLVLTGSGDKAFVVGADITEINQLDPLGAKHFARQGLDAINRLPQLPIPVIAAVEGGAYGIGWSMVLACDMVVSADNARYCAPFLSLGLVPGGGWGWFLRRQLCAF